MDLEEAIKGMCITNDDLETLLYKIGDSPTPPTEDELLNMLIGILDMNKVRYEKMWNALQQSKKEGNFSSI